MKELVTNLHILLLAYLIGSIPFGFLLGKFNGIDIRRYGSGNIGATNLTRLLGRDWGMACFFLDFLKGVLPVIIAARAAGGFTLLAVVAAGLAICGHIWPIFLRFKGGKGVATSLGALIALAPWAVVIAMATWFLVFKLTRYVSVASIAATVMLPLGDYLRIRIFSMPLVKSRLILLIFLAALIIWRHRTNMKRLLQGKEHRFKR